jgi:hypothetical protein
MTSLKRPPALSDELDARATSALCTATAIAQPVQGPRQGVDLVVGMAVCTRGSRSGEYVTQLAIFRPPLTAARR